MREAVPAALEKRRLDERLSRATERNMRCGGGLPRCDAETCGLRTVSCLMRKVCATFPLFFS